MEQKDSALNIELQTGGLTQVQSLSFEDLEDLRILAHSSGWRVYRRLLSSVRSGYQTALLPIEDGSKLLKQTGIIAGINFAESQLGVLVKTFEDKLAKRVAEESKNQPQP